MRRRKQPPRDTPADLYRTPIITDHLIIRDATRADARELERTMDDVHFESAEHTSDGARRFGEGLSEVPVWSATRAVCEMGSARVVGGLVTTNVEDPTEHVQRIGYWLQSDARHHAAELLAAADQRVRALGADVVVMHVRTTDHDAIRVAEETGFRRRASIVHHVDGHPVDFVEYVRP